MIGGNTKIALQIRSSDQNKIGTFQNSWKTVQALAGWMDLAGGEAKYNVCNAKLQESSHVFLSDYTKLNDDFQVEKGRVVDEKGLVYDVMLIDDPMNLHMQLEIYLKYTGGVADESRIRGQQYEGEGGDQ